MAGIERVLRNFGERLIMVEKKIEYDPDLEESNVESLS